MAKSLLLQANLNHCRAAQDLVLASLAQWKIDLAVLAEPYTILPEKSWLGDLDGVVALVNFPGANTPHFSPVERSHGFAVAEWGKLVVIGVYFSPNRAPVIILGDFNAKSDLWGSPRTDARGRALVHWAAAHSLRLLNKGARHTCIRQHGGSIVDLGFATPAASPLVTGWSVKTSVETLSDHRYIVMHVGAAPRKLRLRRRNVALGGHRWKLSALDQDSLEAAALAETWATIPEIEDSTRKLAVSRTR